jgi:hypothetical protein
MQYASSTLPWGAFGMKPFRFLRKKPVGKKRGARHIYPKQGAILILYRHNINMGISERYRIEQDVRDGKSRMSAQLHE